MRIISSSCSWCHESNPAEVRFCHNCGHEAHKARMFCRCVRCNTMGRSSFFPLDLADAMARATMPTEQEVRDVMKWLDLDVQEDSDDDR